MKKISVFISSLAIAVIAFVGCQQIEEQVVPSAKKITLNFAAETVDPAASKATLTPRDNEEKAFDAAWETNDKIGIYALVGDELTSTENAIGTWSGSSFSATISGTVGSDGVFCAAYPYSETGEIDFGSARTQEGNVYNSMYDVMYADGVDATLSEDATVILPMQRQTAIAYFHLTGTPAENETVQSATLTVEGANIAGSFAYDDSGIISDGTSNSITITFAEGHRPSADDFTLWFNVLPVSYNALSLEVTTENYTLSINNSNAGSYVAGKLYKVSAAVPSTMWEENGGDTPSNNFVKVTSDPTDWSGEYLLVYEHSSTEGRIWNGLDAASDYVEATINNNTITAVPEGAVTITIASMDNGYSIKVNGGDKNGSYISGKSGSNTIVYGTVAVANEISFAGGAVTILSNSTSLRYNAASGNDRFRYYKTTTTGASYILPALYKSSGEPAPVKTLTSVAVSGTPTTTTYFAGESFDPTGLTVTGTYDDNSTEVFTEGITWAVTPETLATTTESVSITATVGGVTSPAYSVDVTVNEIPDKTIAQFIASEGGKCYLTGTVSNITNDTYGNFYLTDESGTIYVYGCLTSDGETKKFNTLGITAGDKIKVLADEYTVFNNTQEAVNVIFVEEIEIPKTKSALTITTPTNGTLTVKNGETVVASGTEIEEGTVLTIVATPADNYKLVSIGVKDADEDDIAVTDSKFTMPAKAVTVSATFEEIPPYLTATADKTQVPATGGIFTITVDTNISEWDAESSDSNIFPISNMLEASLQVVVGENTSTETRNATITISAQGAEDVVISLSQAGVVSGEEHTITLNCNNWTNTSYNTSESTFTIGDVGFGYINAMKNGSNGTPTGWAKNQVIQTKSGGYIYNKTSLGQISSIKISIATNTNPFTLNYGDNEECKTGSVASSDVISGTESVTYTKYENKVETQNQTTTVNSYEFDLSETNASFFKFACGSKSIYIYKIEIVYVN